MSKPTSATRHIHDSAKRFQANCAIEWNVSYQWISIDTQGDCIFMQGEEAQDFIDQLNALCKRYPSLDDYTAACALAEPYTDTLFN